MPPTRRPDSRDALLALSTSILIGFIIIAAPAAMAASAKGGKGTDCCGYSVVGSIWYDQNSNGVKEGAEPPLSGWTVNVYDASNVLVGTTTTSATGAYSFLVPVGCGNIFHVKQVVQSGWTQTFPPSNGFHTGTGTGCAGEEFGPYNFGDASPPCSSLTKVYTLDADFNLGTLSGVITNSNQLELSPTPTTWPYAWIANSGEGTISKVDTQTGKEVARYYTGPPNPPNGYGYLSPSRTVIDKDGNCWVANRTFDNTLLPSVTEILTTGGDDRNANSVIETSSDLNADGDCADPGEILPWGQDERVKRHYRLGSAFGNPARGMVIDKTGYLWVGLSTTGQVLKVDPNLPTSTYAPNLTPSVAPALVTIPVGHIPYGLALSPNGLIYMSTLSDSAFQIDPGVASGGTAAGPAITERIDHGGTNYGIAVDKNCIVWIALITPPTANNACVRWDPPTTLGNPLMGWTLSGPGAPGPGRGITVDFNNNVWMACDDANNSVVKYANSPTPTVIGVYPTPVGTPVGVGVASDGNVVVTPNIGSAWRKLDSSTGAIISLPGPQLTGYGPYTYSDFTGSLQTLTSLQQGTWTVITDGLSTSFAWNLVSWTPSTPPGTSVQVEARVAQTLVALASATWTTIASPGPQPLMPGRYIETRARLQRAVEGCGQPFVTPILYDLTVGGICVPCGFAWCPHDTTIQCTSPDGAYFETPVPELEAHCDTSFHITCSPASGSLFPIGTTAVTCTAVSAYGDTVICRYNVTVLQGCNPTPTGACCLQNNCTVTTQVDCANQGGIYFGDGSNCNVGCNYKCIPPPNHMVGWWKLDGATGGVTPNLAHPALGATLVNNPTPLPGEYVNGSYSFDGSTQYAQVPSSSALGVGTGDFSMDAWVKTTGAQGVRPILDKRAGQVTGFGLFLSNGYPALQMADGSTPSNFALSAQNGGQAAFVADGAWHHVAVTVDRDSPDGVRFYVDGRPVGSAFDPTSIHGSLDNTAPLYLARSHPIPTARYWLGALDEIELIHDVLSAAKVSDLFKAGVYGKCPELCYATENVPCCDNNLSNTSSVTICNYDVVSHVYSYGFTAINGGPGCAATGPVSFTPASGTVTVGPGSCVTVPVTIGCPSFIPVGQVACYQVSLFNHDTGRLFACHGSVRRPNKWCLHFNGGLGTGILGMATLDEGTASTIGIEVKNVGRPGQPAPGLKSARTEATQSTLNYTVRAFAGHDDDPTRALRLNGLPPGEPVIGTLSIDPGQTGNVPLQADYPTAWLIGYDRVAVYGDDDGDGADEEIGEIAVRGVPGGLVDVSPLPPPGGVADLGRMFIAVPNPFAATGKIRFRVREKAEVTLRLFDLAGRSVRIFYNENILEPGEHSVQWDTMDGRGEALKAGLYFLKLETGEDGEDGRSETVKVVVRK